MRLNAQVTLLTAGEAKELVEIVPEVVASRTRGECPALSLGEWSFDSSVFLIQARGECWSPGAPSSLLINNYAVDRRTGAVRVEGSKSVVSTPAIRRKAQALLDVAKARLLTVAETRCMAFEAAEAEFMSSAETNPLSVTEIPASDDRWQGFAVVGRAGVDRTSVARDYYVSRETGRVWNEQNGSEVVSAGLGELRSRILALRNTPALSLEDALVVAMRLPSISGKLSEPCITAEVSGNNASADEVYVIIRDRCGAVPDDDELAAAVNILTGIVSDPRMGTPLQSPEAVQVADEILSRIRSSQASERRMIEAQCSKRR
jgi:hypothetical protein